MKILVTGAGGFVGRHLVSHLLQAGHTVTSVTRNPEMISDTPTVALGSFSELTDWTPAFKEPIETVIHLAARVHRMHEDSADPLGEYRRINVAATLALAQAAIQNGVKRFVFVSSIKVNGEGALDSTIKPYEEKSPEAPIDPYAVSKWEAEQRLREICTQTGMELVIVRPPLVYGPGVSANFLKLIKLVRSGWPLPLGAINNRRSFIYVENLASALLTVAVSVRAAGELYFVDDGAPLSTPELIQKIGEILERPVRLFACPENLLWLMAKITGQSTALKRLLASLAVDSTKIRAELAWSPPYTTLEGLRRTLKNQKISCI